MTFVFVTHSQPEALALSHRIAVMNAGRVVQLDTPSAIYSRPGNRFVADFIGDINLLPARIARLEGGHARLEVEGLGEVVAASPAGAAVGAAGVFAIRPEQVLLAAPDAAGTPENAFSATVRDFLYAGDVTTYRVATAGGPVLQALMSNSTAGRPRLFDAGDAVTVGWSRDSGLFLHE